MTMSEQLTIENLKFCKKCGKFKPISEFFRNNYMKDKHDYLCKECRRIYQHELYIKNRDKSKAYYASNKEKMCRYAMTRYYTTDYLEKKYLKRYQESLKKVLEKKEHLENSDTWRENPTIKMKQRMVGYESAIKKWNTKICETEELIAGHSAENTELGHPARKRN